MSFDLYKRIIDGLSEFENPVKTIRLYGFGEPMLNPDFCEMVAYAKRSPKVLAVDTTTNGSRLTRDNCKRLIDAGIDRINISIEGLNSYQYLTFAGRHFNFLQLVRDIEQLYLMRGNTVVFAKIAGDSLTNSDKELFKKIFEPITDGCDIEYTMSCWYGVDVTKNEEVGVYGQPRENVSVCPYIFYSMMVQPGGEVSACFLDWDKQLLIGDTNHDSLKTIWNSPTLESFRKDMLRGIKTPICANCDQLKAGMPVNLDPYAPEILARL